MRDAEEMLARSSVAERSMDLQLQGKRAIVTGGSKGLGKQIAWQLAEEGVDVVIAARQPAALDAAAKEIGQGTGRRIVPVIANMEDDDSVLAMVRKAVEILGGVDILVNNAATPGGGSAGKIVDVDFQRVLADINIKTGGYIRSARAVSPYMVASGWGRIINIGGMAARVPGNYNAGIRCASVSVLTKNLADELGPKGISTIAIHPHLLRSSNMDPAVQAKVAATTISGSLLDASAIAWLVAVLASPRNVAINGETIQAGGGFRGVINY